MNKLKTYVSIITCLAILLIMQKAMAQDKEKMLKESTPEQHAQMQTGFMKAKLNLDTVQTAKLQVINLKYAQKLEPVLKGDDGKFKKMRAAMGIQKDKNAELKKLFTPDQYKEYEKFEDELKEKMKARFKM